MLGSGAAVGATAGVGLLSSGAVAAASDQREVFLTCNAGGTVTIGDANSYEVLKTIDLYPDDDKEACLFESVQTVATEILNAVGGRENYNEHAHLSPDGRTLYGSRGHVGDVVAIDVETNEKLWEHDLDGFRADHMNISADGKWLYVSDMILDKVVRIHAETGTPWGFAFVRDWPHGIHLHELDAFGGDDMLINGSLGVVIAPNSSDLKHRLTFVDQDWLWPRRTVEFEDGVRPFAISHDEKVYLQVSYYHGFKEYDIARDEVTRTKQLPQTEHVPESEEDYPLESAHHGIDISGDGKYICAAATTSWYAAVVRRSDFQTVGRIPVGEHPYWVRTSQDGEHAFVSIRGENEVSVINYERAEEVARLPVGEDPHVNELGTVPTSIL